MAINQEQNSVSQDFINQIISLDADPILRNLKITQCYHDLSGAIANRIGNENVNWCTFAIWASKTAGHFIRMEEFEAHFHNALHHCDDYKNWVVLIQEKLDALQSDDRLGHDAVFYAAHDSISSISADIAAGNLKVFSELAPTFSSMLEAFDKSVQGDEKAIEIVLNGLEPGNTAEGGQDLLRNAVSDFYTALHELDLCKKAELVLRANAQTGLHEQIRLQPYIERAMEAPLHISFIVAFYSHVKENVPEHTHHLLHDFLDHLINPVSEKVKEAWLDLSTHYLMTLIMPDGVLHLGRDLPQPQGQPLFPDHLLNPQDPKLNSILLQYEALSNTYLHSQARNWARFEDRMHYILNLFRSRQQHTPLYDSPFDEMQKDYIRQNMIPEGKL